MNTHIALSMNATAEKQLSPILFDALSRHPIIINGDVQKLSLFKHYLDLIMEVGELEHTSDWDPYLKVITTESEFYTETGYPDISIGDLNDEEQDTALRHYKEITNIGFYLNNPADESDPILTWVPFKTIKSIQLFR